MISERGKNLPQSPIRKLIPYADEAKARGIKVYHLNIGQPDIKTPDFIFEPIRHFEQDVLSYGPSQGIPLLRKAMADYLVEDYSLDIAPEEVFITTGGSEAVLFLMHATLNPQDEILIPEPFYANYNSIAAIVGANIVPIPTSADTGFHLPPGEEIESLVSEKTKAILICSPNNPTGTVLSEKEIKMMVDIAVNNNLWIFSDEVYREFVFDGKECSSILKFDYAGDRIVIIDSVSKRFSSCGARIGFIVTKNKELYNTILKYGQARLCPPTIEQYGAASGFKHRSEFLPDMIKEYEHRRDVVYEEIETMDGVFTLKPEGAFYTVIRLPVEDSEKFVKWMLTDFDVDEKTTMLAPAGGFYGTPGRGKDEARLAYVLKEDDLRDSLNILKEGLYAFNNKG
ncbi:pyridoxal phosphate-dependent aminotransferase [candidate division WOR-3 bacterium]|nr:pyridoxal phosphate-dependent aminotransferase [candidate division WOR-3 bacterium]MCK4528382.1 pyridoxal phosphate-dependent aminotransferase [candidate division WOR-3 bacterium]